MTRQKSIRLPNPRPGGFCMQLDLLQPYPSSPDSLHFVQKHTWPNNSSLQKWPTTADGRITLCTGKTTGADRNVFVAVRGYINEKHHCLPWINIQNHFLTYKPAPANTM